MNTSLSGLLQYVLGRLLTLSPLSAFSLSCVCVRVCVRVRVCVCVCVRAYFIYAGHREAAFIHALSTAVLLQEMVRSQVKCGIHYSVGLSAERSQIPEKKCTAEDFECCTDLVRVFIRDSELQSRQMSSETYWNWVAVNEHNRAVGIEVSLLYRRQTLIS